MFCSVSVIRCAPENLEAYLDLRRREIDPGMAAAAGFVRRTLLRSRDTADELLLIVHWASHEHALAYRRGGHADLRRQALALLKDRSRPAITSCSAATAERPREGTRRCRRAGGVCRRGALRLHLVPRAPIHPEVPRRRPARERRRRRPADYRAGRPPDRGAGRSSGSPGGATSTSTVAGGSGPRSRAGNGSGRASDDSGDRSLDLLACPLHRCSRRRAREPRAPPSSPGPPAVRSPTTPRAVGPGPSGSGCVGSGRAGDPVSSSCSLRRFWRGTAEASTSTGGGRPGRTRSAARGSTPRFCHLIRRLARENLTWGRRRTHAKLALVGYAESAWHGRRAKR